MINFFKILKQILVLMKNIPLFLQLGLMLLALVIAFYWLFNLTGSSAMAFMQPFATQITKFVHSFYHQQAQVGKQVIDGSLLLFDLILGVLIFIIGKTTWFINEGIKLFDNLIILTKQRQEAILNKKLEQDMVKEIMQFDNYAVAIKFDVQDCMVNDFWGGDKNAGVSERKEKIFGALEKSLGALNNIKIAKADNRVLLLARDFQTFDRTMSMVLSSLDNLKKLMMKERWIMNWYISVIIYKTENMEEIYADLQKLMSLKLKNEVICFGNFNLRYNQLSRLSRKFEVERRGSYSVEGNEIAVWRLIKKI